MGRVRRAVATLVAVALVGCADASPADDPSPRAPRGATGTVVRDVPTTGPPLPDDGVLVGVAPHIEEFTQRGRLDAFRSFESVVAAPLDIAHVFHPWEDEFPDAADVQLATTHTLLLSWGGMDTRVIASGSQDEWIRERAAAIAGLGVPVLLRWRWEMDRPNLRAQIWSPEDYVAAWRHIRQVFREEGVGNVAWVWCPHAKGFADPTRDAAAYYPGDDEVDWLCADVYSEPAGTAFEVAADPFFQWAAHKPKPIVIGEYGVLDGDRGRWLREAQDVVEAHPQVRALVYFDYKGGRDDADHRLVRSPDAVEAFSDMIRTDAFDPFDRR